MSRMEVECERAFLQMGEVYNANTPENHPVIFKNESDFKSAMTILGISARMFPGIKIYAFQLMSNHLHLVIGGEVSWIEDFFLFFVKRLELHFNDNTDLDKFRLKLFPVKDLAYMRNAIVYVNRNGFVVNNNVTPFSYPWGSSAYFFQPMLRNLSIHSGRSIGTNLLRQIVHSRKCDKLRDLLFVNGSIYPEEFCDVKAAEQLFRDAKQYFYLISRNVEVYSEISRTIGESIFYNDNDLYLAASRLARESFGAENLGVLSSHEKLEVAKRLHFDYNAGDKQLHRLLKIDLDLLKALF